MCYFYSLSFFSTCSIAFRNCLVLSHNIFFCVLYQIVLEADGYQPYLISPEKGLRSLIKGVLELAKEPSRLCVDEVNYILFYHSFVIWYFILVFHAFERLHSSLHIWRLLWLWTSTEYLTYDLYVFLNTLFNGVLGSDAMK